MISLYKIENTKVTPEADYISAELRGLSTDTKPTEIKDKKIDNGSLFLEIDTGDIYGYDLSSETWNKM